MTNKTAKEEALEKKEYVEHTEQLISFWQGKLGHDDANLISPTTRLLIQDTIQRLRKVSDMFSLGYVQKTEDQSLPTVDVSPECYVHLTNHNCPLIKADWIKVKKE